jgi:perosamine synthetase
MKMEKINFYNTNLSYDAIQMAHQTLTSGMISAGKKAQEFENELAKRGLKNPVTLNSGTVTMMLALTAAGIGPGDEVIIPAQTFIATGMAVMQVGAKVVFCDIDPHTGNIDTMRLSQKITPKTKAIIPVHWAGYPCDMYEILGICQVHNLVCIEDAAHAFGAMYKELPIGSLSRFTSFSFQAIKHLTTGDGGALCCHSDKDAYVVKKLRWFDIDRDNSMESILGERLYSAASVGYKAHMNDLAASIGLGNLKNNYIDNVLLHHREIAEKYNNAFDNSFLELMKYKDDRVSSYWIYPVLVSDEKERVSFIEYMREKEIPLSVVHQGIDKNSVFGGINYDLEGQREFDKRQIHLPINYGMGMEQVDHIIKCVKNY